MRTIEFSRAKNPVFLENDHFHGTEIFETGPVNSQKLVPIPVPRDRDQDRDWSRTSLARSKSLKDFKKLFGRKKHK